MFCWSDTQAFAPSVQKLAVVYHSFNETSFEALKQILNKRGRNYWTKNKKKQQKNGININAYNVILYEHALILSI